MPGQQRRFDRKSVRADFRGRAAEGRAVMLFETTDLSPGGSFLKSDLLLEEGEALRLEFRLPGSDRLLHVMGRIAWVRRFPRDDQESGMGIEFFAMSQQDRDDLSRYLNQLA